jgi:hypothetical protein
MYYLKTWWKIKYLTFIMYIIEMNKDMARFSLSSKTQETSKYICDRELSAGRISLHRCSRKKWYMNMEFERIISHEAIEKSYLSKEILYVSEISYIGDFLI